uniref:HTH cro/C1-type domain-containing protein n=1 Tax=uncultured prokaryote TaxID=198431 RepID=A0A0H5Q6W0_9ZZZZ|nr:hypothetical protein [uncultured prokaryote]
MEIITPKRYREIRLELDLSQFELAQELGISREHVCRRETGEKPISKEASLALLMVQIEIEDRNLFECVDSGRQTLAKMGIITA